MAVEGVATGRLRSPTLCHFRTVSMGADEVGQVYQKPVVECSDFGAARSCQQGLQSLALEDRA